MIPLTRATRLLFIGDSITDCDRRSDPEHVGHGYARLVRDHLCAATPKDAPLVINRGISGNKITDLQKRWQRDVIDERPDVLSIFIGINDVWHGLFPGRDGTTIDAFRAGYRDILTRTRDALSDCAVVLCEPTVIGAQVHADANDRLGPYVVAVHEMAGEFAGLVRAIVPLHIAFLVAGDARPDIAWTSDGVHPTSTGHMLIARAWLAATELLNQS
jgi:lysophospholipase L1-like esterase